jgi:mono/diheme cytochrome c family protein
MKTSLWASGIFVGTMALALAACASNSSSTPAASETPPPSSAATPFAARPTMDAQFPPVSNAANPATSDSVPAPSPAPVAVSAPPAAAAGAIDFDTQVKPFFANYCLQCHGPKRQSNRVRFDTQLGLKAQLTPGDPDSSRMYRAMTSNMPPEGMDQPTPADIAIIKQWITEGATISANYPMDAPASRPVQ